MPKLNLGRVVGRDGGFGNIDTVYLNDGGAPSVTVEASGEDTAKDFVFTFKNLVRDVATADEVEQIAAGEIVQSSNVITAGVMSSIWAKIKAAFAPKSHTHDASDITAGELAAALIANGLITEEMLHDGAVTGDKIANGSITKDKLEKTLGDSLSRGDAMANNSYIADANDLMAGLRQFGPETANAPAANSYGFIQTIANAVDIDDTYLWRYQIGFSKGLYLRWKINANGVWSAWMKL